MQESKPTVVVVSPDSNFSGALAAVMAARFDMYVVDSDERERIGEMIERVAPIVFVFDATESLAPSLVQWIARSVPTLVLGPDEPSPMIEAVEAGALGYMNRESSFKEIEEGATSVAQKTAVIPPFMLGSLLYYVVKRRRGEADVLERLSYLTNREQEVFRLAALGLRNQDVANRLFISPATARTHLHRIFKKLDIHSKAELVALAAASGLPTSEES